MCVGGCLAVDQCELEDVGGARLNAQVVAWVRGWG